jgi:hypothetical protein
MNGEFDGPTIVSKSTVMTNFPGWGVQFFGKIALNPRLKVVSWKPKDFEKANYLSVNRILQKRRIVKKGKKIGEVNFQKIAAGVGLCGN